MPDSDHLPPKPEVALALLQTSPSVYVHLDPRAEGVVVPQSFKRQPQLVLQIGMNMVVAIPDLDVGDDELSCTLSFNRRPHFVRLPWSAIYGLIGEDGRGMIWPESVPPEVTAAAEGRAQAPKANRPKLRLASARSEEETGAEGSVSEPASQPAEPGSGEEGAGAGRSEEDPTKRPAVRDAAAERVGAEASSATAGEEAKADASPDEDDGQKDSPPSGGPRLPPYLRVVK